ncbi:MAG: hypothetical protein KGZ81_04630 [Flavobacteriales bacterium]|jgi:antitoxin component of RelBE/YafQ-DinJ toxin-antitoxin module|nr:hypothetical protein [Flavobacteriales bacterium]
MKTVSLKIDNEIFEESEDILSKIKISRNRYINEAIRMFNKIQKRKMLEEMLQNESLLVRDESINVLQEFESIEPKDESI